MLHTTNIDFIIWLPEFLRAPVFSTDNGDEGKVSKATADDDSLCCG